MEATVTIVALILGALTASSGFLLYILKQENIKYKERLDKLEASSILLLSKVSAPPEDRLHILEQKITALQLGRTR